MTRGVIAALVVVEDHGPALDAGVRQAVVLSDP
jgi:hypothetical protein